MNQTVEKILGVLAFAVAASRLPEEVRPAGSSQDAALYTAVLRHYLHQDAMLWSRVQLLIAIQAGVLGGSTALRSNSDLAASLLILGAFFTTLLLLLARKDELDRDVNVPLLDALGQRILAQMPLEGVVLDPKAPIRLTAGKRPWHVPFRGRTILWLTIALLLVLDLALAYGYLRFPDAMGILMGA